MLTIKDFERQIVFKDGRIDPVQRKSFITGEVMNGFQMQLYFEPIKYIDFEGQSQEAELELFLFMKFNFQRWQSVLGNKRLYKSLIGQTILLPVNPEPEYNDNSIWINYGCTPIDVPQISFQKFDGKTLSAEVILKIVGSFESDLEDLSTNQLVSLEVV